MHGAHLLHPRRDHGHDRHHIYSIHRDPPAPEPRRQRPAVRGGDAERAQRVRNQHGGAGDSGRGHMRGEGRCVPHVLRSEHKAIAEGHRDEEVEQGAGIDGAHGGAEAGGARECRV